MLRRLASCRRLSTLPAPPSAQEIAKQLDELDLFAPVMAQDRIPAAFRWPTALALLPMLAGGVSCVVCPHFSLCLPLLPKLTHATVVYTALHSSLHSGIHWGLACATPSSALESSKQFALATAVPCLVWSSLAIMSVLPYSEARWMGGLAVLSLSYAATFGLDWLYANRLGRLPAWYLPYKVWITLAALFSLVCIGYGTYRFPALTINPKSPHSVPSVHEILTQLS